MGTFVWRSSAGVPFAVEPIWDVDEWTGREMRTAEKLCGGTLNGFGEATSAGLVMAVSIARVVPGYTIESADAELTFGRLREIIEEVRGNTEPQPEEDGEPAESGEVLSPTSGASGTETAG